MVHGELGKKATEVWEQPFGQHLVARGLLDEHDSTQGMLLVMADSAAATHWPTVGYVGAVALSAYQTAVTIHHASAFHMAAP